MHTLRRTNCFVTGSLLGKIRTDVVAECLSSPSFPGDYKISNLEMQVLFGAFCCKQVLDRGSQSVACHL